LDQQETMAMLQLTSFVIILLLSLGLYLFNGTIPQAWANDASVAPEVVNSVLANGPLRVHPTNPRYFTDNSGQPIYLSGSHTWTNLQDVGDGDPPPVADYTAFLNALAAKHHNFFRLWRWEQARWGSWNGIDGLRYDPHPYPRSGPGTALDGKPKFDLSQFNQAYFDRMRQRVQQAGQRGIYVSVMLFDGWSIESKGYWGNNPWPGHPYHAANNINGVNGDVNGDGEGTDTHTLTAPAVLALQEAYVRKVIDTVNDLDNVLYEISNESSAGSEQWQYHMIRFIKTYEAGKPKQHPVGMSTQWPWPNDDREAAIAILMNSPADWISPSGEPFNRPKATGAKVIVADTDHLCGICGDRSFVWQSFTMGENPLFMDVWDCSPWWYPGDCARPTWPSLRDNLGYTRDYAERIDLVVMLPRPELFSSGFGLANPVASGAAYLGYFPNGGSATVDLRSTQGTLNVEWFNPETGLASAAAATSGGAQRTLSAPFAGDAVLYLYQTTSVGNPAPTHTPLPPATATNTPAPTATNTPIPPATATHTPAPAVTNTPAPLPTATSAGPASLTIALDAVPDIAANQTPVNHKFTGSFGAFWLGEPPRDGYPASRTFRPTGGVYTINKPLMTQHLVTAINCTPGAVVTVNLPTATLVVTVSGGENITCTFITERKVNIRARVYHDQNGDRKRNSSEPYLLGWTVQITQTATAATTTALTGSQNRASFERLPPGAYQVCTVLQNGWVSTQPMTPPPCYTVTLAAGQTAVTWFGHTVNTSTASPNEPADHYSVQIYDLSAGDDPDNETFAVWDTFLPLVQR
jgi:hypothetical protein